MLAFSHNGVTATILPPTCATSLHAAHVLLWLGSWQDNATVGKPGSTVGMPEFAVLCAQGRDVVGLPFDLPGFYDAPDDVTTAYQTFLDADPECWSALLDTIISPLPLAPIPTMLHLREVQADLRAGRIKPAKGKR